MNKIIGLLILFTVMISCKNDNQEEAVQQPAPPPPVDQVDLHYDHKELPVWAQNASMYEVNVRHHTPEGTFKALIRDIPRIQLLGTRIVCLLPVQPISEKKKRGSLGSYNAVSDYSTTNPDYGSIDEFKAMVAKFHEYGMYVIIDWVSNHTGWDHSWIDSHPDWYTQNSNGKITTPRGRNEASSQSFSDVAALNFKSKEMRKEMIDQMNFWVEECDVDGFRFDLAKLVPPDFWTEVNTSLVDTKPLFLISESEIPSPRNSKNIHATYGWSLYNLMNEIAQGKKTAKDLTTFWLSDTSKFSNGFHVNFTSNHKVNSSSGTVFERMGDAYELFAALSASFTGMPMIFGGQESLLEKRLSRYEKDSIDWGTKEKQEFYTYLTMEKLKNKALWNGPHGANPEIVWDEDNLFVFDREHGNRDRIVGIFNLSDKAQTFQIHKSYIAMRDIITREVLQFGSERQHEIGPWQYFLMSNKI